MSGTEHAIEHADYLALARDIVESAIREALSAVTDGTYHRSEQTDEEVWNAANDALRCLDSEHLLAPAPLREEALADEPEPWRCPGCNSDRWIRAPLTRGLTVITQCVPCGRYVNCPPPVRGEEDET